MQRAYYSAKISEFVDETTETLFGKLMVSDEFSVNNLQKNAWREEIDILMDQLRSFENGEIAFEYTIPRMGRRIDAVFIIHGVIFLLEFKVGESEYKKSSEDQVMDYALDLKYFHELSADRYIIPVLISTEAPPACNEISFMKDKISNVLKCTRHNIGFVIDSVLSSFKERDISEERDISIEDWIGSRYVPTPTIIEAAQAMYRNHLVNDISRNDADAYNCRLPRKQSIR